MKENKYFLDSNISLAKRHHTLIRNTNYIRDLIHEKMGILFDDKKACMEGFVDSNNEKVYRLIYPGRLGQWHIDLVFDPEYPFYGFVYDINIAIDMSSSNFLDKLSLHLGNFTNYHSLEDFEADIELDVLSCRRTLINFMKKCLKSRGLNKDQNYKLQRLLLELL